MGAAFPEDLQKKISKSRQAGVVREVASVALRIARLCSAWEEKQRSVLKQKLQADQPYRSSDAAQKLSLCRLCRVCRGQEGDESDGQLGAGPPSLKARVTQANEGGKVHLRSCSARRSVRSMSSGE